MPVRRAWRRRSARRRDARRGGARRHEAQRAAVELEARVGAVEGVQHVVPEEAEHHDIGLEAQTLVAQQQQLFGARVARHARVDHLEPGLEPLQHRAEGLVVLDAAAVGHRVAEHEHARARGDFCGASSGRGSRRVVRQRHVNSVSPCTTCAPAPATSRAAHGTACRRPAARAELHVVVAPEERAARARPPPARADTRPAPRTPVCQSRRARLAHGAEARCPSDTSSGARSSTRRRARLNFALSLAR